MHQTGSARGFRLDTSWWQIGHNSGCIPAAWPPVLEAGRLPTSVAWAGGQSACGALPAVREVRHPAAQQIRHQASSSSRCRIYCSPRMAYQELCYPCTEGSETYQMADHKTRANALPGYKAGGCRRSSVWRTRQFGMSVGSAARRSISSTVLPLRGSGFSGSRLLPVSFSVLAGSTASCGVCMMSAVMTVHSSDSGVCVTCSGSKAVGDTNIRAFQH